MKWEDWELRVIDVAVEDIYAGSSIYSWVWHLWESALRHRSWDSIRSKIGQGLKRRKR